MLKVDEKSGFAAVHKFIDEACLLKLLWVHDKCCFSRSGACKKLIMSPLSVSTDNILSGELNIKLNIFYWPNM